MFVFHRRTLWGSLIALIFVTVGCSSNETSTISEEAFEPATPDSANFGSGFELEAIQVHFPPTVSQTQADSLTIRGSVQSDADVTQIMVNGMAVTTLDELSNWTFPATLAEGVNSFDVTYIDSNGQTLPLKTLQVSRQTGFISPKQFVFDEDNGQFYVLDLAQNAVLQVDSTTGAQTQLSPVGDTNLLATPRLLTLDPYAGRLIVYQASDNRFLSINLSTGEQTVLADNDLETDSPLLGDVSHIKVGEQNQLLVSETQQIFLDTDGNVVDQKSAFITTVTGVIYGLDISDGDTAGDKSIVNGFGVPDTENVFGNIVTFDYSAASNNFYVVDLFTSTLSSFYRLLQIDKDTGVREELVSTETPLEEDEDTLYRFIAPTHIQWDETNNQLWVFDNSRIARYDTTEKTGVNISTSSIPEGGAFTLASTESFTIAQQTNTAFVLNDAYDYILSVNGATGERTLLSGNSASGSDDKFLTPNSLMLDATNKQLVLSDGIASKIFALDINSGEKTTINKPRPTGSSADNTEDEYFVIFPLSLSEGPESDLVYALDNINQYRSTTGRVSGVLVVAASTPLNKVRSPVVLFTATMASFPASASTELNA